MRVDNGGAAQARTKSLLRPEVPVMIRRAAASSFFWISLALLAMVIFFTFAAPEGVFLSGFNLQTLAADASVLLILATALTLVIVSGGLDLSVGSVMTFSAVIGLVTMRSVDGGEWLAVALGAGASLLGGVVWGVINGLLIAYVRIPSFVVTLGSLGAALGVARLITGGLTQSGAPEVLQSHIGAAMVAGVPVPFLIATGVALLFALVMAGTRFGERLYLVGSNEEGARRGGIATNWLQFRVYVLSGALAGLAGLVDLARFGSAGVSTGHVTELLAGLAAVIIGGASLLGGSGLIIGSAIGVFIPVVLNNGLIILGATPFWQEIVVGTILVAAVALDQFRRRGVLQGAPPNEPEAPPTSEQPAREAFGAGDKDAAPSQITEEEI